MISLKQKDDYSDKTDTSASESTGEQMQVPCDENAHSDPDSSATQHPSDKSHEEINNTEDKESLMDSNLKIGVTEDHKLLVYDSKRLASSITKDVYKVLIGATWSNIPCNKQPSSEKAHSSCDVPTKGSPATQDKSEKQDTPTTEHNPATPRTEDELLTTDSLDTPVSSAAEQSPATEIQGSPAIPTRGDPTKLKLVSDSVSDEEESGPSGEDGESSNANADIDATPCGEDQVEVDIASTPNETPVSESEMNLIPTEVATAAETNETPVGEGEPDLDCDGPSGQDEIEEVKISLQSNESNIACGQGETLPTTTSQSATGACFSSNHLPTDTMSSIIATSVPVESESESVEGGACLDNSATSSNANKANVTSTESTTASLLPASEVLSCDAPSTDTSLDSASDECNVNTPDKCHKESSDTTEDVVSPAEHPVVGSMVRIDSCTNTLPADVKPDDVHKATEIGGTVDAHAEAESEECHRTAGPDGIVVGGICQPNDQNTTLVSCGDHTNSPATTEADDDSGCFISLTNVASDVTPDEKSTCSGADCPPSVTHEAFKADSSDSVPLFDKCKSSIAETSFVGTIHVHIRVPSLFIILYLIPLVSSQTRAANLAISISNVTEIVTMMLGNDSESFSATDQSEMLTVYWIVAISFIMGLLGIVYLLFCHQSIFFILGLVVKACKNACNCVWRVVWLLFEYTGRRSGQRVEVVPPLTSATYVLNNVTNSVKPPSNEATPPRVNEHSSSSFEALSSKVSENLTSNSKHLLVQQSTDSGYHSMPPMPHSPIALLSGKDRRVCVNGEPLHPRFDQQSTRVQYDISSQTTELESVNVLEPVSSPQPTGKKGRTDDSNAKVECTNAENCDPGESDSVSYHRRSPQTDASGGEVQQETTQPSERSSVFAGLTHRCREQTIQILPPIMIQNFVVPPQENVEPSPVQTIALPIGPASDVLAFNATVEETEHVAPDLPEDVPNVTPITLESLFINLERGLQLHVDLADAEVDMFQLQPPPFAQPYASQGDAADSAPVYPPLPGVPFANAELQPVFPPLPALPSTSTPTVVILITYVP